MPDKADSHGGLAQVLGVFFRNGLAEWLAATLAIEGRRERFILAQRPHDTPKRAERAECHA
jgi:hypothetical protein